MVVPLILAKSGLFPQEATAASSSRPSLSLVVVHEYVQQSFTPHAADRPEHQRLQLCSYPDQQQLAWSRNRLHEAHGCQPRLFSPNTPCFAAL